MTDQFNADVPESDLLSEPKSLYLPGRGAGVRVKTSRGNGAPVFWLLFTLGVGTFAPCIIVPEWRNYQVAKVAEQREKHRLDKLRQVVATERRQVDAIQNDPTVVARLAQRDLGFRRPGETVVPVDVGDSDQFAGMGDLDEDDFVAAPVVPPSWFTRATWWLPNFDYDAIFCDPSTRPIVMLMSISVIIVAVVLFNRPSEILSTSAGPISRRN